MTKKITFCLALLMMSSHLSLSMSLEEAKKKGLVGETRNGYIASVTPNKEADELVKSINGVRKMEYEKIATQSGETTTIIEQVAGEKLISKLEKGQFYLSDGQWNTK